MRGHSPKKQQRHLDSTITSGRKSSGRGPEPVRIELLGGFRLWVGSRAIEEGRWRLRKARSLIKLLALSSGHRLHREQIMEALWPAMEPHAAANNLHQVLHMARRTLEPAASPTTTTASSEIAASGYLRLAEERLTLCPESPVWVDVEAFEEAAAAARQRPLEPAGFKAAIDLYAGELLPEDRYEGWVEEKRAQLEELYLSLLREVASLLEEREEYEEAIEALERVVAHDATREGAHLGLMRLFALSGRRREALGQYERLREALSKELGTEPEEATTRLQQEIWASAFPQRYSDSLPDGLPIQEGAPSGGPAASTHRTNLPLPRTSFVGRGHEMVVVKRLLTITRLLTLTGAGGCGKTRLALEVARDLVGAYPDGVWLVELAPLSDDELVPQALASALGVREQPGRPLIETLKDTLRKKKMLLVVDNCEHLVEAAARLVDALLASCPGLRVLATSRERLNTSGEVNRVVPSLTVPHSHQQAYTLRELEAYESVRLFVQRARQGGPSFELSQANGEAVAQVCQRLEGIPLAIELAAARIGVLSAGQLARRLDDSLKVLSAGERTAEPRHRSLRSTLEWSHDLLSDKERVLYGRLSVFAGGWTLEAAEEVCSGEGLQQGEVLEVLSGLVEKSLVVAEASPSGGGELRYRMLEPIRQYGRELLEENGESEALRSIHAWYYLKLAEGEDTQEADPGGRVTRSEAWLSQMEIEHANLRAALSWALDTDAEVTEGGGREELGLRLASALFWSWQTHGYLREGRSYLERALSSSSSDPTTKRLRARALDGAGLLAHFQGDHGAEKTLAEEALTLYRQAGDEEGIASALTELGMAAVLGQRDDIPLRAVMEELGEIKPRLRNRTTLAELLVLEGMIAVSQGDIEQSVALHRHSLELFREIGYSWGILMCLSNLSILALIKGDYEEAVQLLRENLRLARDLDFTYAIQFSCFGLACVAASQEQPVRAAGLWGAVEGMEEAYGGQINPITYSFTDYEGRLAAASAQLDEETWSEAWAKGKAMALEEAVEYALSEKEEEEPATLVPAGGEGPPGTSERRDTLTAREREVALLVGRGLTNRQIAKELSISESTVENHLTKVLKKLGFSSRARIATWVAQR